MDRYSYLNYTNFSGKVFHGKPADIWAAGGTLYYFLYGRPPFYGLSAEELKRKVINDELTFPQDSEVSEKAKNLISACLTKDPEKRITLQEIMVRSYCL